MQECFALTSQLLSRDAYALEVFPVHIAACVELQKKNELFLRGHRYGCTSRAAAALQPSAEVTDGAGRLSQMATAALMPLQSCSCLVWRAPAAVAHVNCCSHISRAAAESSGPTELFACCCTHWQVR